MPKTSENTVHLYTTVALASGGTLTLSATLDPFALNAKDRAFVYDFIDKIIAYEKECQRALREEAHERDQVHP